MVIHKIDMKASLRYIYTSKCATPKKTGVYKLVSGVVIISAEVIAVKESTTILPIGA